MRIEGIRLIEKSGGRSGHYPRRRSETQWRIAFGRRCAATRARARRAAARRRGAARRSGRPRACLAAHGAAHAAAGRCVGDGRLCGARRRRGDAPVRLKVDRRGRGRAAVCADASARRSGAHFHRRRGARRRRHHRDPGTDQARRRRGRSREGLARQAAMSACRGSISRAGEDAARAGHRSDRRAISRLPPA